MTTPRQACPRCGAMILISTAEHCGGLCMPCHLGKRSTANAAEWKKEAALQEMEWKHALKLDYRRQEYDFLYHIAVYCELECCHWDAVSIDEDTFRRAIRRLGLEASLTALGQFRANLSLISAHTGYIDFIGYPVPAEEMLEHYTRIITLLESITAEEHP